MNLIQRKYVPDLSEYMSQCEINYALLMRLFALAEQRVVSSKASHTLVELVPEVSTEIQLPFHLRVLERAKYTTTVRVEVVISDNQWVKPVQLTVRLYHDAQLAEVMEEHRSHTPKHKHEYPRQIEHYPDDKFQRNALLKVCLSSCFEQAGQKVTVPLVTDATQGS